MDKRNRKKNTVGKLFLPVKWFWRGCQDCELGERMLISTSDAGTAAQVH